MLTLFERSQPILRFIQFLTSCTAVISGCFYGEVDKASRLPMKLDCVSLSLSLSNRFLKKIMIKTTPATNPT